MMMKVREGLIKICGRYSVTISIDEIIERFGIEILKTDHIPRFNIAPGQQIPVITRYEKTELSGMKWGLIPFWSKEPGIGSKMINARGETVSEKPAFRQSFQKKRCLIPADGFYEWQKTGKSKKPFRITLKDGKPFAFAGLWDNWQAPGGEMITSCTILTTTANSLVTPVHDRMPVIFDAPEEKKWLDPTLGRDELLSLLKPYSAEEMVIYEVSALVNNAANELPGCIEPMAGQVVLGF